MLCSWRTAETLGHRREKEFSGIGMAKPGTLTRTVQPAAHQGEGPSNALWGPVAGPPIPGAQPQILVHPAPIWGVLAPRDVPLGQRWMRACGEVTSWVPTVFPHPQRVVRPGSAARPEVGLLLSEGCRQGLGTSR